MTIRIPPVDSIRIIPRDADFLTRKLGSRGEVFFDQQNNTLRLYDGVVPGGIPLLKADFSNAEGVIGAALGDNPPTGANVSPGTIWFNTSNGRLYILYNDGNSIQWVQPATPSYGAGAGGGGASALVDLSDVTITTPATGQVLKYNGTRWTNQADATGGGTTYQLPFASTSSLGGVKVDGTTIQINASSGVISVISGQGGTAYVLPTATTSVLGGIKIGTGLTIDVNGVVSAGAAPTSFNSLTDVTNGSLTIDRIGYPAITTLVVTNIGAASYRFDQYGTTDNPTIFAISGTTIAFKIQAAGHPFVIQDSVGNLYSNGLIHVADDGTTTLGAAAQNYMNGTLYWKIPANVFGTYRYQCSAHAPMVGAITVKSIAAL